MNRIKLAAWDCGLVEAGLMGSIAKFMVEQINR